jgi:phosphatidylglycerophosphatase A
VRVTLRSARSWIAIGAGAGRAPWAPGTAGSLVGLGLAWLLALAGGGIAVAAGAAALTALGLWAAGDAERSFGRTDPPCVVIDEIAGQVAALAFLEPSPWGLLAAFTLFRLFDIAKPFPARRLEALPGASGIMADDLLAGLYANLVLHGIGRWLPVAGVSS